MTKLLTVGTKVWQHSCWIQYHKYNRFDRKFVDKIWIKFFNILVVWYYSCLNSINPYQYSAWLGVSLLSMAYEVEKFLKCSYFVVQSFWFYSLEFNLFFKHWSRIQPHYLWLFLYKYICFLLCGYLPSHQ